MGKYTLAAGWTLADQVDDAGKAAFIPSVKVTDATGAAISFNTAGLPASTGAKTGALSLSVVPNTDTYWTVQGVDASGATITARPVLTGGYASNAAPSATTAGKAISPWLSLNGATIISFGTTAAVTATSTTIGYIVDNNGTGRPLFTLGMYSDGTNARAVVGDANAAASQPALTTLFWSYAAANLGIVNTTTAVTIKTAAGASVRNYIEALQLDWEALGTATEVAIRDGASGTVLWRTKIGIGAAGNRSIAFRPALKGTANTLLEIVTLTASVTGAVYANAQGWTGT